ncbi:hypothetical protein ACQZ5D_08835 [Agrobacterium sp. 22-211-1]|uniref:DAHP synthetase I/KDSA domain-containing protein n=2 Tax=Hyphomicrobiales TaxID=356 RepID=A0ABW0F123_9HYPH
MRAIPRSLLHAPPASLVRSAMALSLAGLFLEAHPDPDHALCDGPSPLCLAALPASLSQEKAVDDLVKSFDR